VIQFSAHFDGKNICPDEPIALPTDVPLVVTVNDLVTAPIESNGALDLFERIEADFGLIDGPDDWAAEQDHNIYGAPRKSDGRAQ
jgi:hypothetical protein